MAAADAVVAAIDVPALATYLAQKSPEEGPGAAKRKKEMDEQKAALVEALEKKATALLEIQPSPPSPSASQVVPCLPPCLTLQRPSRHVTLQYDRHLYYDKYMIWSEYMIVMMSIW